MSSSAHPSRSVAADPSRAFDAVILPLGPTLLRAARGLTRDPADANDLVQDTLERALKTFDRFEPGTNARAWSMAILSRLFIDRWRQRRRQPRFVDVDCMDLPAAPLDAVAEPPESWDKFTTADVRRAAAELPASLRRIFELSAFTHLSYGEISAITGIPASTVGTRLLRARRRLRAILLAEATSQGAAGVEASVGFAHEARKIAPLAMGAAVEA